MPSNNLKQYKILSPRKGYLNYFIFYVALSLNKVGGPNCKYLRILCKKSHFYKILLFLFKTITHKFWTCKNDLARFYIKLTIVPPPMPWIQFH